VTAGSKGLFITLEGGEGSGKSTLAATLEGAFAAAGHKVWRTREPGGTPGADTIRALLVQGKGDRWTPMTELLLVAAARHDHVTRRILPALLAGDVVICDRFSDSTKAYQAGGGGLAVETVDAVGQLIDAPSPHLTLLLDIDPALGLARSRGNAAGEDRFETLGQDFHARVRLAFLALAHSEPHRIAVLDAEQPADAVAQAAFAVIKDRLDIAL
jgi:dTMP kinase